MSNTSRTHIYCVDDDLNVRDAVGSTLEADGFKVTCFDAARACLDQLAGGHCDLVISEVKMPDMDGISLLKEIKGRAPWLPVLIVSAYGDKRTIIDSFRAGATDFIEKPLKNDLLLTSVRSALKGLVPGDPARGLGLSDTEMRVLRFILQGKCNTEIAYLLHRSLRTVEGHRNRIMRKLDAHNLVELIKRTMQLGLVELEVLVGNMTGEFRSAAYLRMTGDSKGK